LSEAVVIDGAAAAGELRQRIAAEVDRLRASHNVTPGLAAVMVGDDPASQIYLAAAERQAKDAGIVWTPRRLAADIRADELLTLIRGLNRNRKIHGAIVLRPLPSHLDPRAAVAALDPDKDVDGAHVANAGRLVSGEAGLAPCTALACLRLLRAQGVALAGRRAVVVGRSPTVGKPVALMLAAADCTVTLAHRRTEKLDEECCRADILVAATGVPGLIRGDWIKPGAVVLDVGIHSIAAESGAGGMGMGGADAGATAGQPTRTVGDVDFAGAIRVAAAVTPVPGGVGPMTVACQLLNTLIAAARQAGADIPEI
jgi:methylenetetrahydrofolate dehydrogenase (NADP+)/methenyltetrahydrofolate cyclohydrolase